MSDKPTFGPGALHTDQPDSVSPADQTPHFGVHSTHVQNTAPQATVNQSNAIHSADTAQAKNASAASQDGQPTAQETAQAALNASKTAVQAGAHWLKQVFSTQSAGTWVKYFFISALGFIIILDAPGELNVDPTPMSLNVLNFLLYPLTATIFRAMGDFFHHRPGQVGDNIADNAYFSMVFFGDGVHLDRGNTIVGLFYLGIRFGVFMLKYYFSFIIGPLAFLFLLHKVRKAEGSGQR